MTPALAELVVRALDVVLTRVVLPRLGARHVSDRTVQHVQAELERERAEADANAEIERRRRAERQRVVDVHAAIRAGAKGARVHGGEPYKSEPPPSTAREGHGGDGGDPPDDDG